MRIDAHHHLWDLQAVSYPWLMEWGVSRFFGDPTSIQRDYLLPEFREDAGAHQIAASVHIQVGAADGLAEARWIQSIADADPDWPLKQVVFADLCAPDLESQLDAFQSLSTVAGVRQIIGRAPGEDLKSGTNDLLTNPKFIRGLAVAAERGLSFDLQLLPELMEAAAKVFAQVPSMPVALCHAGSPHDRSASGLASYGRALHALSDLPQIVCKISGLGMFDYGWTAQSVAPFVSTCVEQFGSQRLMFGSNFPVDSLSSSYAALVSNHEKLVAEQSDAFKGAYWGGTAAAFYGFA